MQCALLTIYKTCPADSSPLLSLLDRDMLPERLVVVEWWWGTAAGSLSSLQAAMLFPPAVKLSSLMIKAWSECGVGHASCMSSTWCPNQTCYGWSTWLLRRSALLRWPCEEAGCAVETQQPDIIRLLQYSLSISMIFLRFWPIGNYISSLKMLAVTFYHKLTIKCWQKVFSLLAVDEIMGKELTLAINLPLWLLQNFLKAQLRIPAMLFPFRKIQFRLKRAH